ncbi:MAG: hypothetical protein ABI652_07455, partial [Acidobacteriota bacterium]
MNPVVPFFYFSSPLVTTGRMIWLVCKTSLTWVALAATVCLSVPARAAAQSSRERYSAQAAQAANTPRIDGVLDEAAWQSASVIDEFTQQEPRLGAAATERTEVRVLFDSRHVYIGVHAYDSQPESLTATEMRRDSDRLMQED